LPWASVQQKRGSEVPAAEFHYVPHKSYLPFDLGFNVKAYSHSLGGSGAFRMAIAVGLGGVGLFKADVGEVSGTVGLRTAEVGGRFTM
jgi:hypothetical protein